jgi:hypothetical protein
VTIRDVFSGMSLFVFEGLEVGERGEWGLDVGVGGVGALWE